MYHQSVSAYPADEFVTTWKTDNPGTSNSTSITIPTAGIGYNYQVDWDDDGIFDQTGITGSVTHDFGTAGTYVVRIKGSFPSILFNNTGDKEKILSVEQWGLSSWNTMYAAFYGAKNLVINASDTPDLSNVASLHSMFRDAESLGGGAGSWNWNTGNVTTTREMFRGATTFNKPLNSWDVSQVTDMNSMFDSVASFNQPLNSWNVGKVTNMTSMFYGASSFNQQIGLWDTSKVTTMRRLFYNATSFNQPLSSWDTGNVTDLGSAFRNATSFNQNINSWDTAKVTNMQQVFYNATSFNQPIGSWNTGNVTSFYSLFDGAVLFNQPIGSWDTSKVTNMEFAFRNATSFNQPLSSWDTGNVTSFYSLFDGAVLFDQGLGLWNTGSLTNIGNTFRNATSFNQNINSWDTAKVTNMQSLFNGATSFNQPLGSWDMGNVTNMEFSFEGATLFNQSLNAWDTSKVTSMHGIFRNATSFNQNINSWDTAKVVNMKQAFFGAVSFDQDIGGWSTAALSAADDMFKGIELSIANYDALLESWNAQSLNPDVIFSGGDIRYCTSASARTTMIESDNWTITDAGRDCPNAKSTSVKLNGSSSKITIGNTTEGNEVGILSATDLTINDTHNFAFTCTVSGVDDKYFVISGDRLKAATNLDYRDPVDSNADSVYEICIRVTDSTGNTYDQKLIIFVTDQDINNNSILRKSHIVLAKTGENRMPIFLLAGLMFILSLLSFRKRHNSATL